MGHARLCGLLLAVAVATVHSRRCDVVTDCGVPTDNVTLASAAIRACFVQCSPYPEVVVPPGLALQLGPLNLTGVASNGVLELGAGSGLYATCDPTQWPLVPMLPLVGLGDLQYAPLLGGSGG
jgi:hypothetical protein